MNQFVVKSQPPEPYEDRAALADQQALAARLLDDQRKFTDFKIETDGLQKQAVKAANLGRELGLSFQEYYLPPKRELAEGWFNTHYRKRLGMSFAVFHWFIAIARKLPAEARTMADAERVLQLTLFAGELIELPTRDAPQVSHEPTPYTYFFNSLRGLQSDLEKRLVEAGGWDAQTRLTISGEIERAERFLAAAKELLK